ncbi:MAG TPA: hypothetical protein PLP25_10050 [Candidatus Limiplasma sp.]|nr:hypothetical protein [Candidatus Limiplasma sp.]HPS82182.1 hypothetical protein [Candidatus Limiplasma sp.]
MSKFIPYQKLPKKQQRAMDREKRGTWGAVQPITRCPARSGVYNRSQENCRWQKEARHERPSRGSLIVGIYGVHSHAALTAA